MFDGKTPEMRLLELCDLAERLHVATHVDSVKDAVEGALKIVSERIRVTANEVRVKPVVPASLENLQPGDEVWIRAKVSRLELDDKDWPVRAEDVGGSSLWVSAPAVYRSVES